MVELMHEIWVEFDDLGQELPGCCLAGPIGDGFRQLLEPGARLIHTFKAGSYYEAMTIYHQFFGARALYHQASVEYASLSTALGGKMPLCRKDHPALPTRKPWQTGVLRRSVLF
jgi:hypothetical protein